jgi:hypothetical protein
LLQLDAGKFAVVQEAMIVAAQNRPRRSQRNTYLRFLSDLKLCCKVVQVCKWLQKKPKKGGRDMTEESRGVREVESWLSPSQAGAMLGTSGQWVTQLARRGELDAVRTPLGWLVNPADVERVASERLKRAEQKISAMKSARSAGVAGARTRRVGRGRAKRSPTITVGESRKEATRDAGEFADRFMERYPGTFHELSKR